MLECDKENCEGNLLMLHRCQELGKEDMIGRFKAEQKLLRIQKVLDSWHGTHVIPVQTLMKQINKAMKDEN